MEKDIRWKQRFSNYKKAFKRLNETIHFYNAAINNHNEIAINVSLEALIKCFELSFELAWQIMKDYVSYKGFIKEIFGSRDSIRGAVQYNIIENGDLWMDMIDDRNLASHVYDEVKAKKLADRIINIYIDELNKFETKMDSLK